MLKARITEYTKEECSSSEEYEEYEEDKESDIDMEEVADLVKDQEDEIKQQRLEIHQMNDTIIILNKEVERLTKISEKDIQEID